MMYVIYDIANGVGGIGITRHLVADGYFYYPSECQWMIPGTVDPRDD